MTRTRRTVASLLALLTPALALAGDDPYIELIMTCEGEAGDAQPGRAIARVVLDAGAPPASNSGTIVAFDLLEASASTAPLSSAHFTPAATVALADGSVFTPTRLSYNSATDLYTVQVSGASPTGSVNVTFIVNPGSGFTPGLTSPPDAPEDYLGTSVSVTFSGPGAQAAPAWFNSLGFIDGAVTLRARAFDPPPAPEGCSVADLAPPFGQLDFSDVVAYLTAFGAGCP